MHSFSLFPSFALLTCFFLTEPPSHRNFTSPVHRRHRVLETLTEAMDLQLIPTNHTLFALGFEGFASAFGDQNYAATDAAMSFWKQQLQNDTASGAAVYEAYPTNLMTPITVCRPRARARVFCSLILSLIHVHGRSLR
jgi:hypothetical protein